MIAPLDHDLAANLDEIFAGLITHDVIESAETTPLLTDLWHRLSELDLPGIGIAEERGGSGGDLTQVLALALAAGRHAVPLPLVEHHLAAWLLAEVGQAARGLSTVSTSGVPADAALRDGTLTGRWTDVAWAEAADDFVTLAHDAQGQLHVVRARLDDVEIAGGQDLAGQPRATLSATDVPADSWPTHLPATALAHRGALVRGAQLSGLLESAAATTLRYVKEREQFGAPIGTFQSVQLHLVTIHQMATATLSATERAAAATLAGDGSWAIDALRIIASENVATAARSAHQAHGAIGMTREFGLHHLTRRLHAWRWDFGRPSAAADRLGSSVIEAGRLSSVISQPLGTAVTNEGIR